VYITNIVVFLTASSIRVSLFSGNTQNVRLKTKDSLEGLMLRFPNCTEAGRCALFQNIAFFFQFMCIILTNGHYAVRT